MWKITKQYFKDLWVYFWSLTTFDEKVVATSKEVKKREKRVKKEFKDMILKITQTKNLSNK